jgi:carbonic anhydrase/acetyltransferase-like protein (isoleucine patch superfamily)
MPLLPFRGAWPTVAPDVFVAPDATIIGDVRIGSGASIWYHVVIRADTASIVIGARTNVQDGAIIHVDPGVPCVLGEDCTLGHGAIVHAAHLGDRVLVAMHATVLSRATIGSDVMIAAGAVVPEGKVIPDRVMVKGIPGVVTRELTPADVLRVRANAAIYLELAREHRESLLAAGILVDNQVQGEHTT